MMLVTWPKIILRFSLICRRSCSRMSFKIYAPLRTVATKRGRYLRKMDKRGIGTLSFVRASSEPVMEYVKWSVKEFEIKLENTSDEYVRWSKKRLLLCKMSVKWSVI